MVQRLAAVLDVPLADRNALLLVAGYAPAWPQRTLDAPDLEHIRTNTSDVAPRLNADQP